MAEVLSVEPVIRFCAVISRHRDLRERAIDTLAGHWGEITVRSDPMPFLAGGYYSSAMGEGLQKELVGFGPPIDPSDLANWKLQTNAWEQQIPAGDYSVARPLNLDPGYITQAKFVLATTKDRDHRMYLRDGIFAEITLTYTAKKWVHHRWSYPDYRTDSVAEFAFTCRNQLRQHIQAEAEFRKRDSATNPSSPAT